MAPGSRWRRKRPGPSTSPRNWRSCCNLWNGIPAEALLIDRAQLLTLTAPEMTVLVGGLRVLGASTDKSNDGVFTRRPGQLRPDFFVHLLDMATRWQPMSPAADRFEGRDRKSGALTWTASRVDLVFGEHARLRALAEV